TYRPGQEARFKVIVRTLAPRAGPNVGGFRADDFERLGDLRLPPEGTQARYSVRDPRGDEGASGTLTLNDFRTAAGSVALKADAPHGDYSLVVRIDKIDRLVPDVFAVRAYRLPDFGVEVAGVPEKADRLQKLTLQVVGRYHFGKPLAGARVEARL